MVKKFTFMPLRNSDLDLLCDWLEKPHLLEWWNDHLTREEIKEKYGKRIGDTIVCPHIAYLDNKPIGFIQYYHANKVGNGWWPDEIEGTVGIDQFIGEIDYINRGYGTKMICYFVQQLFQNPVIKKIITDVDPKNKRAIRCYEKSGFLLIGSVNTPDGIANLMVMYRN
jgi:RimJ/RimL family protein N-acetyltransferase